MKLSIKTMLMILIIPASINAEDISYDYVDANYWSHKLSAQGSVADSTYDGYKVSLSKAISKNIHVLATFIDADKSNGDDVVSKSLGFGINYPMNKKTDFVFEYSHFDVVHSYVSFKAKTLINSIEAKINHQFSDDLQLMAGLIRNDHTGDTNLYSGYSASAKYKINDDFSIKYEMQSIKDSKVANSADIVTNELGISYSF